MSDRDPDRLAEIRAYLPSAKAGRVANPARYPADFDWAIEVVEELLGEVERLRGLLKRLEWADHDEDGDRICPVCDSYPGGSHIPDCWLATEIRQG